ncbi:MAG: AmmeMemoRadiSam system protein B [Actinomycetia bacterium]|nr:AmmeMemoRadiSam system protein B [Actinomycetes bacterium]
MMRRLRYPAVSGSFYPNDAAELTRDVDRFMTRCKHPGQGEVDADVRGRAKIVVVPHAGYRYSGSVAGCAYSRLARLVPAPKRVVLLGPAHTMPVSGMVVPQAHVWRTPLGDVEIDRPAVEALEVLHGVQTDERPHAQEHALEVQLPFLQRVLSDGFTFVPVVVGRTPPDLVADLIDTCWGGDETIIVISTDLSHYHPEPEAKALDRATVDAVLAGDLAGVTHDGACGATPLRGAMVAAGRRGLSPVLVSLATSADAGGDNWRVVGYGSFVYEIPTSRSEEVS